MIKFLFKGLLRDKQRSFLPILVVALGVMLVVFMHAYMKGVMSDGVEINANFNIGHVRVTTQSYLDNATQLPNDLALLGASQIKKELEQQYPDMDWAERIRFGGLLDVADNNGETRAQAPVMGLSADFFSANRKEAERLNLTNALKTGHLSQRKGDVLLSHDLAVRMKVSAGDTVSLLSSTMYGDMAVYNFVVCGTLVFGSPVMDRGTVVADISDVRLALDMEDATAELLGFFKEGGYDNDLAVERSSGFNASHKGDEFSPVMTPLSADKLVGFYAVSAGVYSGVIIFFFILAMSIVLWNAGLIGALRRYSEFGVRLAIGEKKNHLYTSLILEAILVGIVGTVIGTLVGMLFSYYMQEYGIDMSKMMKDSAVLMPNVYRAKITAATWFVGLIPGLFSTVLGAALAGRGIYKRKTSQLFKELE